MNVPIGRPVGTTGEAGFSTSSGHSDSSGNSVAFSAEWDYDNSTGEAELLNDDLLVRAKK